MEYSNWREKHQKYIFSLYIKDTFREGENMIGIDHDGVPATTPYVSGEEVYRRYGIEAFEEIAEYNTFVKTDGV